MHSIIKTLIGFCLVLPQLLVADPQSVEIILARDDDARLNEAEELYRATLYPQAALIYEEILQAYHKKNPPTEKADHTTPEFVIMCFNRLGQIYYSLKDYTQAAKNFEKIGFDVSVSSDLQRLLRQSSYTRALCYRYLDQPLKFFEALQQHADISNALNLPPLPEVEFEKGLYYFLIGDLSLAKERFQSIKATEEIHALSQLYLGRIFIAEGDYAASKKIYAKLVKTLPKNSSLQYELAFLRGETAFHEKDYSQAADYFELSLPQRKDRKVRWQSDALAFLGWSYLKIAENSAISPDNRVALFEKAEHNFRAAKKDRGHENDDLNLAQCLSLKAKYLQDQGGIQDANALLKEDNFHSLEAKSQSLLLQAEIAESYEKKDNIYCELTSDKYQNSLFYPQSWYKRGLNDYLQAEKLASQDFVESNRTFQKSCASFQAAYNLLKKIDPPLAAMALKYSIRAQQQDSSPEGQLATRTNVESFIHKQPKIFGNLPEPEEMYYIYGRAACCLADQGETDKFAALAEKLLWQVVTDNPTSSFADASLYLLGTFYLKHGQLSKAEEAFLHLIAHYPNSAYASEALYFCAENAEKLGKDPDTIRSYYQQLIENYPHSQYVPSAYFNFYTYREYLQGGKEALKHLKSFIDTFKSHPLAITAHYIMGLDYKRDRQTIEGRSIRKKNLLKAIESFTDAEKLFDQIYLAGQINQNDLLYYVTIKYRAMLERALANQNISEESQGTKKEIYFQYAEEIYKQMHRELADASLPFTSHLIKSEPFPKIYEESLYGLFEFYKLNHPTAAKIIMDEMLQKYHDLGINKGYYLSRIYYELGLFEMRHNDYEQAWQAFMRSEESSKGKYLSSDQKLDLWIQQSLCYKALGQVDKAMIILSKVINDDAISGLRLKAMYMRAEIYEMQGRTELARKQLEATAKKGGEWAHKAKAKLDSEYEY